jgi:hypothetical protein
MFVKLELEPIPLRFRIEPVKGAAIGTVTLLVLVSVATEFNALC